VKTAFLDFIRSKKKLMRSSFTQPLPMRKVKQDLISPGPMNVVTTKGAKVGHGAENRHRPVCGNVHCGVTQPASKIVLLGILT
jgi:hypothetical protein